MQKRFSGAKRLKNLEKVDSEASIRINTVDGARTSIRQHLLQVRRFCKLGQPECAQVHLTCQTGFIEADLRGNICGQHSHSAPVDTG